MSNPSMRVWDAVKRPPESALKTIKGGRLQGMTDINPQWRYQVMTEQLGPCGVGWAYTIDRLWTEQPAPGGEVLAFALVSVRVRRSDGVEWSDPVPGIGGSKLLSEEKSGLRANDEGYKMAVTDALGTALKMLGVAADIYAGRWDGAKYRDDEPDTPFDTTGYRAWLSNLATTASAGTFGDLVETIKAGPVAYQDKLRADRQAWADLKGLCQWKGASHDRAHDAATVAGMVPGAGGPTHGVRRSGHLRRSQGRQGDSRTA